MDIIGGISAATEGLRLVNELRKIDREVDKAELKLRLVELADKLVVAKQALQEAQEAIRAKDAEIASLKEEMRFKGKLEDEQGLLFVLNDEGIRTGEPYCNHCYVKEEKLYRLIYGFYKGRSHRCSNCSGAFGTRSSSSSSELRTGYDILDPYGS